MTRDRRDALFVLVAFALWLWLSHYWYTCSIKGFCAQATNAVQPAAVAVQPTASEAQAAPAQEASCTDYITEAITYGAQNNAAQVRRLEQFLIQHEGATITVDGIYGADDVAAVKAFQAKYAHDVLAPWGLDVPTGHVLRTTRAKINALYCAATRKQQ